MTANSWESIKKEADSSKRTTPANRGDWLMADLHHSSLGGALRIQVCLGFCQREVSDGSAPYVVGEPRQPVQGCRPDRVADGRGRCHSCRICCRPRARGQLLRSVRCSERADKHNVPAPGHSGQNRTATGWRSARRSRKSVATRTRSSQADDRRWHVWPPLRGQSS